MTTVQKPVYDTASDSIAASGSGDIAITVAAGERYYLRQVIVSPGANSTVNSITIDGVTIKETASFDVRDKYGDVLLSDEISMNVSNAGGSAESSTIEIQGRTV